MKTETQIKVPPVNREQHTAMHRINAIRDKLQEYSQTPEGRLIDQTDTFEEFTSRIDECILKLGDMVGMYAAEEAVTGRPFE